ncbi:MAG TPA: methionyl-tRNA formyltransferase [Leptospiraceae bacterium]|nr:methionyl-tRNA formyltransferase [Leptospirales bacterium]HMU82876.1 methionyl-tRNA formyltransferase [Leptospiraceae bacterium]HMX58675.1 methionyl-tRNA formyltransferase [Leptospiraceae bacterium]HMZ35681.1 methionyl-tRNA formyltransferase [Leptospiraceae bacterium]HNN61349.1 methionyl-tRNA formyltransferase [Leptospiraceae bacterium]
MRIGYMGSPEISAAVLSALAREHEIACVISNPDKPRGRSGELQPTAVSAVALSHGWPLHRPVTLKDGGMEGVLQAHDLDLFFVFAYGRILPPSIFELPRHGSVNLHASILPEFRGASPIQASLLAGAKVTGWTLQKIAPDLDAGDILATREVNVDLQDRALELTQKLMPAGISLSLECLRNLEALLKSATPQDHARATFCKKITRESARIDWAASAFEIHNLVRAYFPSPVAWTTLGGKNAKILRTMPQELALKSTSPGQIWQEKDRLFVCTGSGWIEILEVQLEGKKALPAADFLKGFRGPPAFV